MRVTFIRWGRPNGRCQTRNDEISLTRSSRPEWLQPRVCKGLELQTGLGSPIEPKRLFPVLQTRI